MTWIVFWLNQSAVVKVATAAHCVTIMAASVPSVMSFVWFGTTVAPLYGSLMTSTSSWPAALPVTRSILNVALPKVEVRKICPSRKPLSSQLEPSVRVSVPSILLTPVWVPLTGLPETVIDWPSGAIAVTTNLAPLPSPKVMVWPTAMPSSRKLPVPLRVIVALPVTVTSPA